MNVGELIRRHEEIKAILANTAKLREEMKLLDKLIALSDPLQAQPNGSPPSVRKPRGRAVTPTTPETDDPQNQCVIPDCAHVRAVRGLCSTHYSRFRSKSLPKEHMELVPPANNVGPGGKNL